MLGLHESTFGDHGGQHGQESEESKEGKEDKEDKEDSEEEKEVIVRQKTSLNSDSTGRCARRSTNRRHLSPTEYPSNKQSGWTLMQMAAA